MEFFNRIGRDLPDADLCLKLDRELALSANYGHRDQELIYPEADPRSPKPRRDMATLRLKRIARSLRSAS